MISDVVSVFSERAAKKDIQIKVTGDTGFSLEVVKTLFEQAIVNLVDNAIKYSPAGTEVEIRCAEEKGMAKISVSDQGPGIPSEHLPRIFERFYRIDRARSRKLGGTGLGLAIVKHIMKVLGGTVTVESRPGKGSTFVLAINSHHEEIKEQE